MRKILDRLLGEEPGNGQRLYFSMPAPQLGAEENLTYHEATLKQILASRGFDVHSIAEGLAVIYAELESSNYTGIGISCGGGLCNICLTYLSVPVMSFSIAKAGDFIDSSAATAVGELATRVRITKESSFYLNGHSPDRVQQVLNVYYEDMIQSLANGLREAFSNTRALPKFGRPIPLVLSGGSVIPKGFRDRFEKALSSANFPIALSEVRVAENPLNSTAKGALVAALSEA
jgi:hypothetical protein